MTEQRSNLGGAPPQAQGAGPSGLDLALREVESLHAQLDALRQELVWSNRLTTLGTMSAVLAHEYNNLLTPIGSYAQLALANPDDHDLARKALVSAVAGVAQAQRLAEATLGFARPEDADQPGRCTIQAALDATLVCLSGALERDRIELLAEPSTDAVAMPAIELQQVLTNLIDNARKALAEHRGPRRVRLETRREGGVMVLEIEDNGPGVDPSVVEHLFEAFVTHRPDNSGTGLGLRICRDLVESAGGTIELVSGLGEGARFRLCLPLAEDAGQGDAG